ncbi:MAG TPA: STAS domain-containing protein [Solirubrobacteraceae bacterium]|nr:STAS domain-containing protein [Solirubrobacteraceae bacterium]
MTDATGFHMREEFELDGVLRLDLIGELDLPAADDFLVRVRQLRQGGYPVRVDLSQVTFIDSAGLGALVGTLAGARRDGWDLTLDEEITDPVRRLIDFVGLTSYLWPAD